MARYLITQINGRVAPDGARVVSSANLAETHRPGIAVPPDATNALPAVVLPDTIAMRYCLGWFNQTFKVGRHLLWHGGAIDGFGSQMGFLPVERLGYVFLTNLEPTSGALFHIAVQSSLLSRLYGLNQDLPALWPTPSLTWRSRRAHWPLRPGRWIQRPYGATWVCTATASWCGWTIPARSISITTFAPCPCWRCRTVATSWLMDQG